MRQSAFVITLTSLLAVGASAAAADWKSLHDDLSRDMTPPRALFGKYSAHCMGLGSYVNFARTWYKRWREQGLTEHQAWERAASVSIPWEVFELAAHAPGELSPSEWEDRITRACMLDATEQASAEPSV